MPRRSSSPARWAAPDARRQGAHRPPAEALPGIAWTGTVLGVQAAAGVRAEAAQGVIEVGLGGHQPPHQRGGGQTQQHPGSGGQLQRVHDDTPGVRRACHAPRSRKRGTRGGADTRRIHTSAPT